MFGNAHLRIYLTTIRELEFLNIVRAGDSHLINNIESENIPVLLVLSERTSAV